MLSTAEVVDIGRKHLELDGIDIRLIPDTLAVPLPRREVGRNRPGGLKRFQVMLETRTGQLFAAIQDDSLKDLAGGARAVLVQVPQDGRVGSIPENFDGCLNLLRMIGLNEARHASILPEYVG